MALRSTGCALALALVSASCADTFRVAGSSPAAAATNAEDLASALAARYTSVDRDARYEAGRVRLARGVLVPGRLFPDSVVWTAMLTPGSRQLLIQAGLADGRYHLAPRAAVPFPAKPGDSRHSITLDRTGPSTFQWQTAVDFAIGSISADACEALFSALLGAAESRNERELRAESHAAFPRTTAAFGRAFSIDTLNAVPAALGTTSVTLAVGFHPERLTTHLPLFSAYLDRYLKPAKLHLVFSDRTGAVMFEILGRDRLLTVRYRTRERRLVSLYGPPRPMPDSLVLRADVSGKAKMFTVGFHDLVADFTITRTPHERTWTVVAQREPEWNLPLATKRFIRTPLRHPFEGAGALFQIGVRDSTGAQTVIARRARLDVQESAITRFIGSLLGHAVNEFDEPVTLEQDRFLREGFAALAADVKAAAAPR